MDVKITTERTTERKSCYKRTIRRIVANFIFYFCGGDSKIFTRCTFAMNQLTNCVVLVKISWSTVSSVHARTHTHNKTAVK